MVDILTALNFRSTFWIFPDGKVERFPANQSHAAFVLKNQDLFAPDEFTDKMKAPGSNLVNYHLIFNRGFIHCNYLIQKKVLTIESAEFTHDILNRALAASPGQVLHVYWGIRTDANGGIFDKFDGSLEDLNSRF